MKILKSRDSKLQIQSSFITNQKYEIIRTNQLGANRIILPVEGARRSQVVQIFFFMRQTVLLSFYKCCKNIKRYHWRKELDQVLTCPAMLLFLLIGGLFLARHTKQPTKTTKNAVSPNETAIAITSTSLNSFAEKMK